MAEFEHLLTTRILFLLAEAEALQPAVAIAIEVLGEHEIEEGHTLGCAETLESALRRSSNGPQKIWLASANPQEAVLAHELAHLILDRSGYPLVYTTNLDRSSFESNLSGWIGNLFHHHLINHRLAQMGIHQRAAISVQLYELKAMKDENACHWSQVIAHSFAVAATLQYGPEYRTPVIEHCSSRHPKALALGEELLRLASRSQCSTKAGMRKAMVDFIEHLNRWIERNTDQPGYLWDWLALGGIYTPRQLERTASAALSVETVQGVLPEIGCCWRSTIVGKVDRVPLVAIPHTSSDFATEIQAEMATSTLRQFLVNHRFSFTSAT